MSTSIHFAERTEDRTAGPIRLLTLPTSVERFVSFRGSFVTNPDLAAGDDIRQELAVSMLDRGTQQRDRFELASVLEERGARLNLSSDGLYVDVRGQALTADLPEVLDVLAEMLREPLFDPDEFEKVKAQKIGELQRDLEDTGTHATGALTRSIFPEGHPNFREPVEQQIQRVQATTLDEVRAYHAEHFGASDATLVVVGDLAGRSAGPYAADLGHDDVTTAVADAFGGWTSHDAPAVYDTEPIDTDPQRTTLPMPDKANVDVRFGHGLPLRRDADDYLALYVANFILGGNFGARLMDTVRDEKGLTYHVGSSLSGVSTRYAGFFKTNVTLSHDRLDEGIDATEEVIRTFVEEGATQDELDAKKETILGSYTVGLSQTSQIAHTLLINAERGFDLDYLDGYLDEVEALTLDDVNDAVRTYLHPDRLHVAAAGTRPEVVTV